MDDVVPRRVRPDDGEARSLADTSIFKDGGEASDRVCGLAYGPLVAGRRVHQGQALRVAARRREQSARGRIVGGHEAEEALAAIAA